MVHGVYVVSNDVSKVSVNMRRSNQMAVNLADDIFKCISSIKKFEFQFKCH